MKMPNRMLLMFAVTGMILAACVNIEIAPRDFPYDAMLSAADLGPGWEVEHTSFPKVEGALSAHGLIVRFGNPADSTEPFVAQQLTLYPDVENAVVDFVNLSDQFNLDLPSDPTIDVRPQSGTDRVASRCERVAMNGQPRISCLWLQQHRTAVSFVDGLIDEQALTFEKLTQLIGMLDSRLNKLDLNQPRTYFKREGSQVGVGG